jgi:transcriptional regulator with XRE-family HTH domain
MLTEPVVSPVSGASDRGWPQATYTGFGNRLRLERERRRISLASIAANTKIGLTLLQGLERDDVSRWPSGIFRRSFIRAYAEAVGLDADAIAREFFGHFQDKAETPRVVSAGSAPGGARRTTGDPVLRLTLADRGAAFTSRRVLQAMLRRAAAAAWDVGVLMAIGLTLFRSLHQFWMPLAIATLGYYVAGIVLLGNTPGVCLFAPGSARAGADRLTALVSLPKAVTSAIRRGLMFERFGRISDGSTASELQPTVPQDRFGIS